MHIGAGRPLCCFFWLSSIAVAFYVFICPNASTLMLVAAITAALIVGLLTLSVLLKRWRFRFLYVAFVVLGLLMGLLASLLYQQLEVRPAYAYAYDCQGEMTEIRGIVISHETESSYVNAYGVRANLPDKGHTMLYLRVMGECEFSVGDEICVDVTVCAVTEANEPLWFIRYLRAKGYLLVADAQLASSEMVISEGNFVLRAWLASLQHALSYRLTKAVGGEAGAFVSALLLGTRSALSDVTVLDFRRAGASHLLALSGLHLSMVMLMLDAFLRLLRCPYRMRMTILPVVAVAFLLLTGCSISMIRATVMLLLLQASRMRGTPHDALTPLSVFFGVCLAVRPTWILDVGLWLTVLATLTVIDIIPSLMRREKDKRTSMSARIWTYLSTNVGGSLLVMLALMIPMALSFGEFSWLSPVANLLLTPLTTVILGIGMLCLPLLYLADVLPLLQRMSDLMCDVLSTLAQAMLSITAGLSDIRGALISLRYDFVPYLLVVLLIAFLLFSLFKWRKPVRFVAVLCGWCLLFVGAFVITHFQGAGNWQATYTVHGKSELLTLNEGETTVLCDLTDGSYTTYRELLHNGLPQGTTEIEALVLTHYHKRHIASVYKLLGDCRVRTIFLPLTLPDATQDKATQDEGILRSIAALAKERRVQVRYYLPSEGVDVTDTLTLEELYYCMLKRSTHPTIAVSWSYRQDAQDVGDRLTLLGASAWEGSAWQEILKDVALCDALILSNHGPVIKTDYSVPAWLDGPHAVLFAKGNASTALLPDANTAAVLSDAALYFADQTHTKFDLP